MRDRFSIIERLNYYTTDDLAHIIHRSAGILETEIEEEGCHEIARRSRGTPRIANRLLRRARDFAQVRGDGAFAQGLADAGAGVAHDAIVGVGDGDKAGFVYPVLLSHFLNHLGVGTTRQVQIKDGFGGESSIMAL